VLLFELTEYFQRAASLPDRRGVFTDMSGRDAANTTFFFCRPVSLRLYFLHIFFLKLSIIEILHIISLNFHPFGPFSDWFRTNVVKSAATLPDFPYADLRSLGTSLWFTMRQAWFVWKKQIACSNHCFKVPYVHRCILRLHFVRRKWRKLEKQNIVFCCIIQNLHVLMGFVVVQNWQNFAGWSWTKLFNKELQPLIHPLSVQEA
jgi:hypothetical protein